MPIFVSASGVDSNTHRSGIFTYLLSQIIFLIRKDTYLPN